MHEHKTPQFSVTKFLCIPFVALCMQPVAFGVQALDEFESCHQGLGGGCLLFGVGLHVSGHLCLRLALVRHALGVIGALCGGVAHGGLIIFLSGGHSVSL